MGDTIYAKRVLSKTTKIEKIKKLLSYKPWHLPLIAFHHALPTHLKVELSLKFPHYGLNLYINQIVKQCGININQINEYDHHTCHAASSYYLSPYTDALSITLDEFGDNYASKIYKCNSAKMDYLYGTKADFEFKEKNDCLPFGYMYSRATKTLGLIPNSDEGKVEALAAYGNYNNKLYEFLINNTQVVNDEGVHLKSTDKVFRLFSDEIALTLYLKELGQENFAAAFQKWLEVKVVEYIEKIIDCEGKNNICLSGGVFANVKLNQKIFEELNINGMYIVPAMGDNGSAVGAALLNEIENGFDINWIKKCLMPYWGPNYVEEQVIHAIKLMKNKYNISYENLGNNWPEIAADLLLKGKIIGIFHGKMEYGPRALGNRSVLANPGNEGVKDVLNNKIKRRAWYQPFCPSILEEERVFSLITN